MQPTSIGYNGPSYRAGLVTSSGPDGVNNMVPIEIGPWNMDTTNIVLVPHTLDITKIRGVQVQIINDDDTELSPIFRAAGPVGGTFRTRDIDFVLSRTTNAIFDNASYDDAVKNRGWILVETSETFP